MIVEDGKLVGTKLIKTRMFNDPRGYFMEVYHQQKYREAGIAETFVQDNLSFSQQHVLRGMHFQKTSPQGKLVCAVQGAIWDVVIDIREDSSTYGQWDSFSLSSENGHQLYVPGGFAHGFLVTSESALVLYKCTDFYQPSDECGIAWDDPNVGVAWPVAEPILSEKDRKLPYLRDLD